MKKHKLDQDKKYVRVDHRTIIEVDRSKPDAKAIADFIEKTKRDRPAYLYRRKKENNGS